jgi:hypothetical protein
MLSSLKVVLDSSNMTVSIDSVLNLAVCVPSGLPLGHGVPAQGFVVVVGRVRVIVRRGGRVVDRLLVVTKALLVFMAYVPRVVIGKVSRVKDCMFVVVYGLHVVLIVPAVVKLGMIARMLRVVVHSLK